MVTPRKAHVKRVFHDNGDGTIDEDTWIDVLRVDLLPVAFEADAHDGAIGQIVYLQVKWLDDVLDGQAGDVQNENSNLARDTEQLRIRNPDDPDSDTDVKLYLIRTLNVFREGIRRGTAGQKIYLRFANGIFGDAQQDTESTTRLVTPIKVVNNDLDGNDIQQGHTVDWDAYQQWLQNGTQDDSSHLDVEVTDLWRKKFQADEINGVEGQVIVWAPANKQVEALFAAGDEDAVDINGNRCVVRTDPLQTIVNVQMGGLAVIFGPQDADAPTPDQLAAI